MAITLNHTIVPARDKEAAARFFAQIFGLQYDGPLSHFAPVRVNGELTLDFDNAESFERAPLCVSRERRGVRRYLQTRARSGHFLGK